MIDSHLNEGFIENWLSSWIFSWFFSCSSSKNKASSIYKRSSIIVYVQVDLRPWNFSEANRNHKGLKLPELGGLCLCLCGAGPKRTVPMWCRCQKFGADLCRPRIIGAGWFRRPEVGAGQINLVPYRAFGQMSVPIGAHWYRKSGKIERTAV